MPEIQTPLFVGSVAAGNERQHAIAQVADVVGALAMGRNRRRAWAVFRCGRVIAPPAGHGLVTDGVGQADQDEVLDRRAFAIQASRDLLDQGNA